MCGNNKNNNNNHNPGNIEQYVYLCNLCSRCLLQAAGSALFTLSERFMPCLAHLVHVIRRLTPIVAHICL